MTKKEAQELAAKLDDKERNQYANVGSHVTNGERRYQVHVTHDGTGQRPYTLSEEV